MLMTMMSNGGIGGGVASAIARAIGAGRMRDAEALMGHSVVIAVAFGAAFTAAILDAGEALFSALGGCGEVLANALRYSSLVFGAAVPIWIVNLLAAALRGAGNVRVRACVGTRAASRVGRASAPISKQYANCTEGPHTFWTAPACRDFANDSPVGKPRSVVHFAG
jgi:MATE family, multidrug efflux pump